MVALGSLGESASVGQWVTERNGDELGKGDWGLQKNMVPGVQSPQCAESPGSGGGRGGGGPPARRLKRSQ